MFRSSRCCCFASVAYEYKKQDAWQRELRDQGTPVAQFYEKWRALKLQNERKELEREAQNSKRKKSQDDAVEEEDEVTGKKGKRKLSDELATASGKQKKSKKNDVDAAPAPAKKKKLGQKARKLKKLAELKASEPQFTVQTAKMEISSDEDDD